MPKPPYHLLFEKRVFKDLDKVPDGELDRLRQAFEQLKLNPRSPRSKKLSGKEGLYRVRQGNYRVVYTIDDTNKEVKIILIRLRKEAYRKF